MQTRTLLTFLIATVLGSAIVSPALAQISPKQKLMAKRAAELDVSKVGDTITNSIGMKLTYIPAGEFLMGSPADEEERYDGERQHRVKISKPFLMGVTEVTQDQWESVMGTDIREQRDKLDSDWPLRGEGADYPMHWVSWHVAVEFCEKLSAKEGRSYRLPTESEWEYACRAGTATAFHYGNTISTEQANYDGDYTYGTGREGVDRQETVAVGSFKANAWGLHDMHGNVYEWCSDWYSEDYPRLAVTDPEGPGNGSRRVLRGGSWNNRPTYCRSADRGRSSPHYRNYLIGFRVVLDFRNNP